MKRKKLLATILCVALSIGMLSGCGNKASNNGDSGSKAASASAEKGKDGLPNLEGKKLVTYVLFHEEEGKRLLELFKEKTGCDYEYLRLPAGEAITRVRAEKDSPKADVVLGGSADGHGVLKNEGLLEKYVPSGAKDIPDYYKDKDGNWTGIYVGPLAIAVNKDRWEKEFKGQEMPKTFDDLLNPKFKGEIIMPDPATSGTAYTIIASLSQTLGADKAIAYMAKLKPNVGQFTASGFTPAQKVGTGEYLIGVNFIHDQLMVKKSGFKIESIVPDKAGWEIGSVSIIKGGPNTEAAKAFEDFVTGKEAGQLHSDLTQRISTRPDVNVPSGVKKLEEMPINKNYSFEKASTEKKGLVERYKAIK